MQSHVGFSLIEVLISLIILSILLLGFDAMQMVTLREAKAAYYFSVATEQLNSMLARLEAFHGRNDADQLAEWNKQNQDVLPQGRGIMHGIYPDFVLDIFWGDLHVSECNENKIGQSGCLRQIVKL